jgi:hypothetical protein
MHPFTFQAFIKACSPLGFLIVNINSSIGDRLTTPMITFMLLRNLPSKFHYVAWRTLYVHARHLEAYSCIGVWFARF